MKSVHLVLLQNPDKLSAITVRRSLFKTSVLDIFEESMTAAGSLTEAIARLKKKTQGFASLWKQAVHVCVPADSAVFRNFSLPPVSRAQAKKSVRLLLDSELPFELENYKLHIFLDRSSGKKGVNALVTVLPLKLLRDWEEALNRASVPRAFVEVEPWPYIRALPKRKKSTLLVICSPSGGSMSALARNGAPLWIRQLMPHAELMPENLAKRLVREYELVSASSAWKAEEIMVFSLAESRRLREALTKESGLETFVLGEEIPLGGAYSRISENEPLRLLSMAPLLPIYPWQGFPVFTLTPFSEVKTEDWRKLALPLGGVGLLLLLVGASTGMDARDRYAQARALREKLVFQLRQTLGDVPKNASLGRLQSILTSRLATLEEKGTGRLEQTLIDILRDIHAQAPPDLKIDLRRLSGDEGHIRLYGQCESFEEVNMFRESLASLENIEACRIVNAVSRAGDRGSGPRIDFEIDMARKKP